MTATNQIQEPALNSQSHEVVNMSDEAVALRLAQVHGIGVPVFDQETDPDEIKEIFQDLGFGD